MKKITLAAILLLSTVFSSYSQEGEIIFKTTCTACHTIGKGKLVGPDLRGVSKKYTEKWLIDWIRSSQTMIQKGDAKGKKIFEEYFQVPMPDNNLTDAEIKAVLAYIKSENGDVEKTITPKTTTLTPKENIDTLQTSVISSFKETPLENDSAPVQQSSNQSTTTQSTPANGPAPTYEGATPSASNKTFLYILMGAVVILLVAIIAVLARTVKILRNLRK